MPSRAEVLSLIAQRVAETGPGRRLVGIDGVDGVGKSTFADELATVLRHDGQGVVQVRLDGFLRPAAQRYARGRQSPAGFSLDSIDVPRFVDEVVRPVRSDPVDEVTIRQAVVDACRDEPVDAPAVAVPPDSVVLVDGIFLHGSDLAAPRLLRRRLT